MKQKFYICKHCGNIVAMIRDAGVPIMCCGEKMHAIKHPWLPLWGSMSLFMSWMATLFM